MHFYIFCINNPSGAPTDENHGDVLVLLRCMIFITVLDERLDTDL